MESDTKAKNPRTFFIKFTFLLLGVGSLLGWNCILSNLDFFNFYFTGNAKDKKIIHYTPPQIFPFLYNSLNFFFQLIIVLTKQRFTFKTMIIFGLVISTVLIIALASSVTLIMGKGFDKEWKGEELDPYKNKIKSSFIICNIIILIFGFFSAISTSSIVGLVSFFQSEDITLMSIGQGTSGLILNVIKYIILASINATKMEPWKKNNVGAWIFFVLCTVIYILLIFLLIIAYKTEYFVTKLRETSEKQVLKIIDEVGIGNLLPEEPKQEEVLARAEDNEQNAENEKKPETKEYSFIELTKKLLDINLLIAFVYIITFLQFPDAVTNKHFFSIPDDYLPNTVSFIFNIFDTLGRKSTDWVPGTKKVFYIESFVRLISLITVPVNVKIFPPKKEEKKFSGKIVGPSIFMLINIMFTAFTNGLSNSLSYTLAPLQVEPELQGRAGNSIAFFDILGIFVGSLMVLGTSKLVDKLR